MARFTRHLTGIFLSIFFILILSSCAPLNDYAVKLVKNYEYCQASAYNKMICFVDPETPNVGRIVVSSYVDRIAFDQEYIYVQKLQPDDTQYPPVNEDSPRVFLVIAVESGNLTSNMTETEFNDWYAASGREEPPKWISTKDQPALIDRWEELNPGQRYE